MMPITRPWPEIVEHYAGNEAPGPGLIALRDLAVAISVSRYASGLHAWTSMADLCIAQTEITWPRLGPHLRISATGDRYLEFRYHDTMVENRQWHRLVPIAHAFARLEKFLLEDLRWFPKEPGDDKRA